MASLSELVAAAQATQAGKDSGNSTANVTHSGILGVFAGMQARKEAEKSALDRAIKLLDIQEKMLKVAEAQQNMKIQANFSKAFGVLPLDGNEAMTARSVANNAIGASAGPRVNSTMGKIVDHIQKMEPSAVNFGKGGFSYQFARPKKEEKAKRDPSDTPVRTAIWARAREMALAEIQSRPTDWSQKTPTQPTEDEVWKFVPSAAKYYGEDPKKFTPPAGTATPKTDANDPLSGLDKLF